MELARTYVKKVSAPSVLRRSVELGFEPVEDDIGIRVHLRDGEVIHEPWKMTNGIKDRHWTIYAAALKAVALHAIQANKQKPDDVPSY